ncbi:MAG: AbrB/MazE/SpoVT family DNA-binding domain-containing protein [Kiloniellales bacterium]
MNLAKVTSKGQTTIPKAIRTQCGIREGDLLAVTADGKRIVMTKVESPEQAYLQSLEATLQEWLSDADEEAYRDL